MAEKFPKLGWGFSKRGKLYKSWPKDEKGEPAPAALLTHCGCADMEDVMILNLLEAYGIPCIRRASQDGGLGDVVLGISGYGADLFVPESMLEDALALISQEGEIEYDDNDEQ